MDAQWFHPIPGEFTHLGRAGPLRQLFARLIEQRFAAPGVAVAKAELVAAAWPGAAALHDTSFARLRTSVDRLRMLGLKGVLLAQGDGFLLDPGLGVRRELG